MIFFGHPPPHFFGGSQHFFEFVLHLFCSSWQPPLALGPPLAFWLHFVSCFQRARALLPSLMFHYRPNRQLGHSHQEMKMTAGVDDNTPNLADGDGDGDAGAVHSSQWHHPLLHDNMRG